jgi:hypothetical protein
MRTIWKSMLATMLALATLGAALAAPFAQPAFQRVWERTGVPIQRGAADYSWVWGPEPFTAQLNEAYSEGEGGRRAVQYFDKSRMEINDPNADPNAQWFVTNGLLVNEMVTGQLQIGLNEFVPLGPADIPIAGDPDNAFPTYADLDPIINTPPSGTVGGHAIRSYLPDGFGEFAQYASSPATEIVQLSRGRGIPRAFWEFMNRRGTVYQNGQLVRNQLTFDWLFTLGYPTTEPFWTRAKIGGAEHDVMFQAFERRILTYVPDNPAQYQVEMGNVGRHYYDWRYVRPFAGGAKAIVTVPEQGAVVGSPLTARGFENGEAFEAAITVRLRNKASGEVLATDNIVVMRPDIALAGPWSATLSFAPPAQNTPAAIEVLTFSPRDGSEIPLASHDIVIGPQAAAAPPPVAQARQDLSNRMGIRPTEIRTAGVEYVDWPDAGLGCPVPGQSYLATLTPGYQITLEARGQQYDYHTDLEGQVILCQNGQPAAPVS